MSGPDITGNDNFILKAKSSNVYDIIFRPLYVYN